MTTNENTLKEIKATIQPHMLSKVISALHELSHFPGLTLFKCQGQGHGKAQDGKYASSEDGPFYRQHERLEVICPASQVAEIVATIKNNAHTGNSGDGIITITNLESAMYVRTGEPFGTGKRGASHA